MLDENRLFPAEPAARSVAAKLYASVADLPIISPHGHTDPQWFADNQPFPDPAALFIQPDHYIFRMLYSQGVSLESLGIPQVDGRQKADPREVWRIFARNYYPVPRNADAAVDRLCVRGAVRSEGAAVVRRTPTSTTTSIDKALQTPQFLPRALFERFNIEVLATTDAGLRLPGASPEDQGVADGRGGWCRRSVRMRWWMRSTPASRRI